MARLKSPKVTFIMDNPNTEENTEKIATYLILRALVNPASDIIDNYIKNDMGKAGQDLAISQASLT